MKNLPTYEEYLNEANAPETVEGKQVAKKQLSEEMPKRFVDYPENEMTVGSELIINPTKYLDEITDIDGNTFLKGGDIYTIEGYVHKAPKQSYFKLLCTKGSKKGNSYFVDCDQIDALIDNIDF